MFTEEQIQEIENASTADALRLVTARFPEETVFSTSLGQEDQVLTEMIAANKLPVRIFTLDTGRLFYEHYDLLEKTNARYKINIDVYFPEAPDVAAYVKEKGVNGFYESVENRKECCFIRKVKPLNRALKGAKVWITGLRSEQSDNRKDMKMIEWDEDRKLYKFNPLIRWSYDEMIGYIREKNIPYNPLHDKGFVSIGCAPCTRAIEPGEDPRAGRWWWEVSHKECGLHVHE
ncbi:phosphoadenylyl-sulfate reductase [Niabella beijingensis]|uniref:phosphoadenylyl-sulfate reductase n=1 Tax=Niabella beijingensis TaxID=2872700 RepID=UPI001CBEFEC8|nr:phosphoadenylyl-sulfate reductase [Niabella beijingensis]MBZ4189851.1 phosphoadenylyl-sulfate reductase [Niabella beijingensis]